MEEMVRQYVFYASSPPYLRLMQVGEDGVPVPAYWCDPGAYCQWPQTELVMPKGLRLRDQIRWLQEEARWAEAERLQLNGPHGEGYNDNGSQ